MSSSTEVNEEVHPRRNGWSCPWHPFQFIAWFFIGFFLVAYYGFLVHYIPGLWIIPACIVPGVILLTLVVSTIVTTSIDPAEPEVRRKLSKKNHQSRPRFDRTKHKHVIENLHCNLCQVDVSSNAKHCRTCDKCVTDFDHHCKWLNNCVGSRNYYWFLATIFSALLGSLLLLLYTVALFILYFAGRDMLHYGCSHPTNVSSCDDTLRVFGAAIPDPVFPTLVAVLGVLALIAVGLVGQLSLFHVYLLIKGISTYDHIIQQREKEEQKCDSSPSQQPLMDGNHGRCSCLRRKVNRVVPKDEEASIGSHSPSPTPRDRLNSNGSNQSITSASKATFGRTPPPSETSGDGPPDNLTDEQKLEAVASWTSSGKGRSKLEMVAIEMEIHTSSPAVKMASNDTVINMDGIESSNTQPPAHVRPIPARTENTQVHMSMDSNECGTLAFMAASHSEEKMMNTEEGIDCSVLSAMVVSNSLEQAVSSTSLKHEEEDVLSQPSEEEMKKILVDRATSPTLPAHMIPVLSHMTTQPDHMTTHPDHMTTQPDQVVTTLSKETSADSLAPQTSIPSMESYSSLAEDNLAVDDLQPLPQLDPEQMTFETKFLQLDLEPSPETTLSQSDPEPMTLETTLPQQDQEPVTPRTIPKQKTPPPMSHPLHQSYRMVQRTQQQPPTSDVSPPTGLLKEMPLPSISEHLPSVIGIADKTSGNFPSPPTTNKHVSFQGFTEELESPRPLGRPLASRPLPPIGVDPLQYEEMCMVSPRSRPLPPLNPGSCDSISLQSGSSLALLNSGSMSGSSFSLPLPDSRYINNPRNLPKISTTPPHRVSPQPTTSPPTLKGYRQVTTSFSRGTIPVYDDVPITPSSSPEQLQ